ncbi:MAG: hypothetical protein HYX68_11760 [Planctomycetes bacterium]|nr:hypothetical protein [Planctomycetota bacterium]
MQWYLTDNIGSVRDIVDASGSLTNHLDYSSFGQLVAESSPGDHDRYLWTSREYDAELELQYNRARYYDASTGRWLSQDPLGFDAGDSNLYRYVNNAPTLATDPSGLQQRGSYVDEYGKKRIVVPGFEEPRPIFPYKLPSQAELAKQLANKAKFRLADPSPSFNFSEFRLPNSAMQLGRTPAWDALHERNRQSSIFEIDVLTSIFPGVSDLRDVTEAISGYDVVNQEKLSGMQRLITVGAAVIPIVPARPLRAAAGALGDTVLSVVRRAPVSTHGHHPIPKFLGGNGAQTRSRLDVPIHNEFHSLLRKNLRKAGIPLNVGGRGGSAADWRRYMNAAEGRQRTAFDAVLQTSRAIDAKHGTNITQDVWKNIMEKNFKAFK